MHISRDKVFRKALQFPHGIRASRICCCWTPYNRKSLSSPPNPLILNSKSSIFFWRRIFWSVKNKITVKRAWFVHFWCILWSAQLCGSFFEKCTSLSTALHTSTNFWDIQERTSGCCPCACFFARGKSIHKRLMSQIIYHIPKSALRSTQTL